MSEKENEALAREAVEAFNRGDLDAAGRLFTADYVDHDPSRAGLPTGPEGVKQAWSMMRAAFPDLHFTIEDMIAEGDKVVARFTMSGTHQGEFMGIAATGNRITITGIDIARFENGKGVEHWANQDDLGMMQQLGVIPAPG